MTYYDFYLAIKQNDKFKLIGPKVINSEGKEVIPPFFSRTGSYLPSKFRDSLKEYSGNEIGKCLDEESAKQFYYPEENEYFPPYPITYVGNMGDLVVGRKDNLTRTLYVIKDIVNQYELMKMDGDVDYTGFESFLYEGSSYESEDNEPLFLSPIVYANEPKEIQDKYMLYSFQVDYNSEEYFYHELGIVYNNIRESFGYYLSSDINWSKDVYLLMTAD